MLFTWHAVHLGKMVLPPYSFCLLSSRRADSLPPVLLLGVLCVMPVAVLYVYGNPLHPPHTVSTILQRRLPRVLHDLLHSRELSCHDCDYAKSISTS